LRREQTYCVLSLWYKDAERECSVAASHGMTQWHFCASAHKERSERAEWYSTNIFCMEATAWTRVNFKLSTAAIGEYAIDYSFHIRLWLVNFLRLTTYDSIVESALRKQSLQFMDLCVLRDRTIDSRSGSKIIIARNSSQPRKQREMDLLRRERDLLEQELRFSDVKQMFHQIQHPA